MHQFYPPSKRKVTGNCNLGSFMNFHLIGLRLTSPTLPVPWLAQPNLSATLYATLRAQGLCVCTNLLVFSDAGAVAAAARAGSGHTAGTRDKPTWRNSTVKGGGSSERAPAPTTCKVRATSNARLPAREGARGARSPGLCCAPTTICCFNRLKRKS